MNSAVAERPRGLLNTTASDLRLGEMASTWEKVRWLPYAGRVVSFRGEIGAGKTTAAEFLVSNYGFMRAAFADPLKAEVYDALTASLMPEDNRNRYEQKLVDDLDRISAIIGFDYAPWAHKVVSHYLAQLSSKASTTELIVKSINFFKSDLRPLIQFYGTEFRRAKHPSFAGRSDCHDEYWVNKYAAHVRGLLTLGFPVVTDDARYGNERDAIKRLGGVEIFIINPYPRQAGGIANHASEALNDPTDPGIDFLIANQRPVEKFHRTLKNLMADILA